MPLLSPAEKRKNIGRLLARGIIHPWVIPFSAEGNLYHHRSRSLELIKRWFTPEGDYAKGGLRVDNPGSREVIVPRETIWQDAYRRNYQLTELAVVPPKGTTFAGLIAQEPGDRQYTGKAWVTNWPDYNNYDEDEAEISILYQQTELICGEMEDLGETAECMALDVSMDITGGAFRGTRQLVVWQKNPLSWLFYPRETLGGFQVMTEKLSGYVFHRLELTPTVQFPVAQVIKLRPGTIFMNFLGIELEERG